MHSTARPGLVLVVDGEAANNGTNIRPAVERTVPGCSTAGVAGLAPSLQRSSFSRSFKAILIELGIVFDKGETKIGVRGE